MKRIKGGAPLLLMAVVVLTNVHCQKESGSSDNETSGKTELLTSGKWYRAALTSTPGYDVDGDGDLDTDRYSFYEACDKDDYYLFNKDGTTEHNAGPTTCAPFTQQIVTGSWRFTDNETKIIIGLQMFNIDELTSTRFRISADEISQAVSQTFSR